MSGRDAVAVHGALGAAQMEVARLEAEVERLKAIIEASRTARLREALDGVWVVAETRQGGGTIDALGAAQLEVESLRATLERVRALAASWETATPRLAELAETRSAAGDDSLTRALAIGRSYAVGLRAALEDPS